MNTATSFTAMTDISNYYSLSNNKSNINKINFNTNTNSNSNMNIAKIQRMNPDI